jgi:hypothetical protein
LTISVSGLIGEEEEEDILTVVVPIRNVGKIRSFSFRPCKPTTEKMKMIMNQKQPGGTGRANRMDVGCWE